MLVPLGGRRCQQVSIPSGDSRGEAVAWVLPASGDGLPFTIYVVFPSTEELAIEVKVISVIVCGPSLHLYFLVLRSLVISFWDSSE